MNKLNQKVALGAVLATGAISSFAATDLASLASEVSFTTVAAAIFAVATSLLAVKVTLKGVSIVMGLIRPKSGS